MVVDQYDVVVIGGGILGCAIAYFASQSEQRVALIDQGVIGGEAATRYSGGILRVYDPDPVLIELAHAGVEYFHRWEKLGLPGPRPVCPSGSLYLAAEQNVRTALQESERLRLRDYPIEMFDPAETRSRFPFLRHDHPGFGLFEEQGGYGNPRLAARNLAEQFRLNGGTLFEHCRVNTIEECGNGDYELRYGAGKIEAQIVVVAAGAASRTFLPSLPIWARSISLTQVASTREMDIPVIDEVSETFIRPIAARKFYCGSRRFHEAELPELLHGYSDIEKIDALRRVQHLLSRDIKLSFETGIQGYDCYTATYRPFVGFWSDTRVYVATGGSGRAFKYAIALGEAVANEVIGLPFRESDFSLSPALLERLRPPTLPSLLPAGYLN